MAGSRERPSAALRTGGGRRVGARLRGRGLGHGRSPGRRRDQGQVIEGEAHASFALDERHPLAAADVGADLATADVDPQLGGRRPRR